MTYSNHIKGFLDKFSALLFGIVFSPLILLICLMLFITQGKHIIYQQIRTGKHLNEFKLYKFRTLKPFYSNDLSLEHREFTFLGKALRRTGLDELPQFINIIRGEMSFIGPRPMPAEYLGKYKECHLKRFELNPGITGWAQIHGRNDISWDRRFDLDVWYVNNLSFTIDLKIFWLTLVEILRSIIKPEKCESEMQVFNGSNLN